MKTQRLEELLEDIRNNPTPTDADIQFAGSICSILSYYRAVPVQQRDYVPGSTVDEMLQDLVALFSSYVISKTAYQSTQSEIGKAEMLDKLDSIIDTLRKVFIALRQSCNTQEEHERLKTFFRKTHENCK